MPYRRKGKCVYKKSTGKKVGCSDSAKDAKEYLKALYASEMNESFPNTISPSEYSIAVNKYMKEFLRDKRNWIDQYGLEKANFIMYKTAVKKAKEELESK